MTVHANPATPERNAIARGIQVGDTVSIEGRGRYEVAGFEIDGDAVVLVEDGERFTVYAWRVEPR